jgi:hypothetical protein
VAGLALVTPHSTSSRNSSHQESEKIRMSVYVAKRRENNLTPEMIGPRSKILNCLAFKDWGT